MTSGKSILVVLCLSPFCLCSSWTSNASATTMHECLEEPQTGQTTKKYNTSTCSEENPVDGKFRTAPIPPGTFFGVKLTATSSLSLAATIAGIKFKMSCSEISGSGGAVNIEEGVEMKVHGTGVVLTLGECQVEEPPESGCTVPATIVTGKSTFSTRDEAGDVMKTTFTPETGTKFVTIPFTACEGKYLGLNGNKDLTGTFTGLTTSENPASTTFSTSNLKLAGQTATLIATTHFATSGSGKTISLETESPDEPPC